MFARARMRAILTGTQPCLSLHLLKLACTIAVVLLSFRTLQLSYPSIVLPVALVHALVCARTEPKRAHKTVFNHIMHFFVLSFYVWYIFIAKRLARIIEKPSDHCDIDNVKSNSPIID